MTALVRHGPGLAHLAQHRGFVLSRSVSVGLAGLVPVPIIDQWVAALIERNAVQRLADASGVDLTREAVLAVADGPDTPPSWRQLATGPWLAFVLRSTFKRAFLMFAVGRRAQEITRAYARLTLVDHYCQRVHVGAGLDVERARRLRAAIDAALRDSGATLLTRVVRRGLFVALKSSARTPLAVLRRLSRQTLTALFGKSDEVKAEKVVERMIDQAHRDRTSFVARARDAIGRELDAVEHAYVTELVGAFEPTLTALGKRPA